MSELIVPVEDTAMYRMARVLWLEYEAWRDRKEVYNPGLAKLHDAAIAKLEMKAEDLGSTVRISFRIAKRLEGEE
jgi:hypothetical protein